MVHLHLGNQNCNMVPRGGTFSKKNTISRKGNKMGHKFFLGHFVSSMVPPRHSPIDSLFTKKLQKIYDLFEFPAFWSSQLTAANFTKHKSWLKRVIVQNSNHQKGVSSYSMMCLNQFWVITFLMPQPPECANSEECRADLK